MLKTLQLDGPEATFELDGKLEPVTEFRLFAYGTNDTTQGPVEVTEAAAAKAMAVYQKRTKARGGILDIDWYHLSRKSDSRLEDRRSAGRCKLELREDGIWVVGIKPTAEARTALEEDKVRSYSPVVRVNPKGLLLEIAQLSLTNIPSMDDAGLLAAEETPDDDEPIKPDPAGNDKEISPMPELTTLSATPRIELLLLEAKWSNEMRDMLAKAVGYRFGEHSYLEDWSPEKLRVCVYGEGPMPSRHYEIPYTMTADKIDIGEPVEVVMSYVPKAQAGEAMALQEREHTAHTRLLELTEAPDTTQALIRLEALIRDAAAKPGLETRVATLEEDRFQVARKNLIGKAREAGKWTQAAEEQGDRFASQARKLLEDPVKALESHWNAATVLVAPANFRPPKPTDVTLELSEEEEETAKDAADRLNRPLADVRTSLLEEKRTRAARA